MERDYISYSIDEFLLLGRKDALENGKRDSFNIIDSLLKVDKYYCLERLKNYLLGYRIGIVELSLLNVHEKPTFDMTNMTLKTLTGNLPNTELIQIVEIESKKLILERIGE